VKHNTAWVVTAARLLNASERLLVLLGEGTSPSESLSQLVQMMGAAVALSPGVEYSHPELEASCIGRYSFGRRAGAANVVEQADVVLGLNVDFSEFLSRGLHDFRGKPVIHLFDDPRKFLRGVRPAASARVALHAAIDELQAALCQLPIRARPSWFERDRGDANVPEAAPGTMHPREVVRCVEQTLPADATISLDIGGFTAHVLSELGLGAGHRLFCPIEREGVMGEAMLAALGMHDADESRRVLVIVGDGGFAMVPAEVQRAIEAGARLTILIWQNCGFQAVEEGLRQAFGPDHGLPSGVWSQPVPDFARIASGWGAEAHLATDAVSLRRALKHAFAKDGTSVVVAVVDPSVVSPMQDRFERVGNG
jgi:thiamine pyrophosphate-dependent acetolactate synthase large subunit-like protein